MTSPYGKVLHHREKVMQDQFSFNTAEPGVYLACFSVDTLDKELVVNLNLDWKTGIATKDWDALAKIDKLEAST